jgi:hypothetical protein
MGRISCGSLLHNTQFPNVGAWSSLQGKVEHQFTEYNITA